MSLYSDNFGQREVDLISPPEISRRSLKRALDIILALSAVVFLLPALVVIAIALLLVDGRPIIFRHRRMGRGGRSFSCLKFRSMRKDADKVLTKLLESDPERRQEWSESQKLRNDPRIHWLGKMLRITSLDELPQLFNILVGDMSIVGPRPIVADELERYGSNARYYLAMTPGLTGLWQVSRGPDTSYEERVQFDLDYYKSCSMRTDIAIIMRTIVVVLFARNDF
ncbi:exopolysaccharide production protein ExoY [Pseudorhizobium tarimense]|uniref:Exopolysaccharide production protein ExoY n=1 Tax=Pseudorhizobium tarimense TaxID=1079109 RepID=A0ABV2H4E1_9HYPH|nr:sugar transferase [Pseudorhizobium tarimense]MCJ8518608.1 sugar transferase [Pseudorhizobium tarimense]